MSRCNFDGWSDVIGEVPWCLSMQTTVRHEAELESDPLSHVQPVQFVVQECRQSVPKRLFPIIVNFTYIYISQGSVATPLRCGGKFSNSLLQIVRRVRR